jgi:hypothetical protein
MKNNLIVIENVLTDAENQLMLNHFVSNQINSWIDGNIETIDNVKLPLQKILKIVNNHFDLSNMLGVECWSNINVHTGWHIDFDDMEMFKTKQLKTPICSIVYYVKINNLIGGNLITKTESYTPKTNDLVTFKPGLIHNVEKFSGERMSIAINPWEYKIETYKSNKTLI